MTRQELVAGALETIQQGSKSFRAASRLFDRETRERAWLLYCWCRHCDDICDGQKLGLGSAPRGAVSELRAKTRQAFDGESVGEFPFDALRQLLCERQIPFSLLDEHLQGFELDEAGWQPASEEDLIRYCYHVAGTVGCMMAIVMGISPDDSETMERAADLGTAFQLSNIARDIAEDLENGRCYLPADWLVELQVSRDQLFSPQSSTALLTMTERLVGNVIVYESSARRGVHRLPFRSRFAVLTALRIYGAIGRRVGSLGAAAWERRVVVGKTEKLAMLVPSFAEAIRPRRG